VERCIRTIEKLMLPKKKGGPSCRKKEIAPSWRVVVGIRIRGAKIGRTALFLDREKKEGRQGSSREANEGIGTVTEIHKLFLFSRLGKTRHSEAGRGSSTQ